MKKLCSWELRYRSFILKNWVFFKVGQLIIINCIFEALNCEIVEWHQERVDVKKNSISNVKENEQTLLPDSRTREKEGDTQFCILECKFHSTQGEIVGECSSLFLSNIWLALDIPRFGYGWNPVHWPICAMCMEWNERINTRPCSRGEPCARSGPGAGMFARHRSCARFPELL